MVIRCGSCRPPLRTSVDARRGGLGEDLLAGIDDVVERGLDDIGQRILFQHLNHARLNS